MRAAVHRYGAHIGGEVLWVMGGLLMGGGGKGAARVIGWWCCEVGGASQRAILDLAATPVFSRA